MRSMVRVNMAKVREPWVSLESSRLPDRLINAYTGFSRHSKLCPWPSLIAILLSMLRWLIAGAVLLPPAFVHGIRFASGPQVTPPPAGEGENAPANLERRQGIQTELSTCGYINGDPSRSRTAEPGFNCRIDTQNGLWGFCPTSVISASDCGLAAACQDSFRCSTGCGNTRNTALTTFTWWVRSFFRRGKPANAVGQQQPIPPLERGVLLHRALNVWR